jgi:hypothetical protein
VVADERGRRVLCAACADAYTSLTTGRGKRGRSGLCNAYNARTGRRNHPPWRPLQVLIEPAPCTLLHDWIDIRGGELERASG